MIEKLQNLMGNVTGRDAAAAGIGIGITLGVQQVWQRRETIKGQAMRPVNFCRSKVESFKAKWAEKAKVKADKAAA